MAQRYIRPYPDQKRLHEILRYDPNTGQITWKCRPEGEFSCMLQHRAWNGHHADKAAGTKGREYRTIGIGEAGFLAHRLAWIMVNGPIPDGLMIDHINGDGHDNRLENLRLVTNAENQKNQHSRARSASGFRGVYFNKRLNCYAASVTIGGKLVHLGLFDDPAVAGQVAANARRQEGYSDRHTGT